MEGKMEVDIPAKTVSFRHNSMGRNNVVKFADIQHYFNCYNAVVNTADAENSVQIWRESKYDPDKVVPMLHAIIVKFGSGQRFVWSKYGNAFAEDKVVINKILSEVDQNSEWSATKKIEKIRSIRGLDRRMGNPAFDGICSTEME
jgi:hypothetical protein